MKASVLVLALFFSYAIASLEVAYTTTYSWVYDDKGSGASDDVACYLPTPPAGYTALGTVCLSYYNTAPTFQVPTVVVDGVNAQNALGFTYVWFDKGSGGDSDGSFWQIVCPIGFWPAGGVVWNGYNAPSTDTFACVADQYVFQTPEQPTEVYNDQGSGACQDGSIWQFASTYSFVQAGYNAPVGNVITLFCMYYGTARCVIRFGDPPNCRSFLKNPLLVLWLTLF